MSKDLPVGGKLLKEILTEILTEIECEILKETDNMVEKAQKPGARDLKDIIKNATMNVILSGEWRRGLKGSLKLANNIMDEIRRGYEHIYDEVIDFRVALKDYGLVGTGSGLFKAIFEVGLEMDWVLGLPYYPGSTLKGAVRSIAEELLGFEEGKALFGGEDEKISWAGHAVFAPSYPVGCINQKHPCLVLTMDVVTPHYLKPGKGIVETELDVSTNPIVHVAIAPETVFRVVVGIVTPREEVKKSVENAIKKAKDVGLIKGEGRSNSYELALLIANLTVLAMSWGFAARASKGYNVMKLLGPKEREALSTEVVSLTIQRGRG